MNDKLLGIPVIRESKEEILEKIKKYLNDRTGFCQIISLNAENLVITQHNQLFKEIVIESQIKIVDGVGVTVAGRTLGIPLGPRFTGVDLMKELLLMAHERRLTVMLIGGRPKIADKVADCQGKVFFEAKFIGLQGISNINAPKKEEEDKIFSIVARHKPQFLFASFGSPNTEIWLQNHKKMFSETIVMSVGGAFDFLSGDIVRAPQLFQRIGLEWLFRLIRQPWRAKRQLRLIEFVLLVIKERFGN